MSDTLSNPDSHSHTPRLVLILGGARSGKSTFAERLAATSGRSVVYIATATASDDEMRDRIARHQASRPAHWLTIEEPLDIAGAVLRASEKADVLLLDCITLWLGNFMGNMKTDDDVESIAFQNAFTQAALVDIERLLAIVAKLPEGKTLLVVSNEVGLGIVPAYALGRVYRDTLGIVNQRLAWSANRVYMLVAGLAIDIKRLHEEAQLDD
ncbi:MAG TPA: bifunctional adenosylcobinamide kinase/adenosylcobinamide-phosphate guanylyltransferase [Ktedonobacter sp.]|nr:bifunctional adenosylcobinamide kinase/adenosylcobinamide-phosphate guanylyltransferase [Ktedonobacter sp.]